MKHIIQQIACKLIEESLKCLETTGLNDIGKTIAALKPLVSDTVLNIVGACVQTMDDALVHAAKAQRRKDGWSIKERNVERTLLTSLGDFVYKRTYFQNQDGCYAYLLDSLIGVESYERISKETVAELLQNTASVSYQQAVDTMNLPVSRQTVHNRLLALDDLAQPVQPAEKTPEVLDLFVDEDHVHLSPKGSAIVPLVTITEGMDKSNPKRHRTIHPLHIAAFGMDSAAFGENVLAALTERYNMDEIKQINIHADGGLWIEGLQKLIPRSRLVMDGYHLEKRLRSFIRMEGAHAYAGAIRRALSGDNYEAFEKWCHRIYLQQSSREGQDKVRRFVAYCSTHWDAIGIRLRKEVCGSCTEPLVSHILSDRLSRRPIAWSRKGLNRMTMLVAYTKNGGCLNGEDTRIRVNQKNRVTFAEDGYAIYCSYAQKQADSLLTQKHDWSLFDHGTQMPGKVNGPHLIRKSLGACASLSNLAC